MPVLLLALGAALVAHEMLVRTSMTGRPPTFRTVAAHAVATAMVLVLAHGLAWAVATGSSSEGLHGALAIGFAAALSRVTEAAARRHAALHRLLAPGLPLLALNAMVLAGALQADGLDAPPLPAAIGDTAGVAMAYGGSLLALAALAERLEESPLHRALRGAPATVIGALVLGLAIAGLIREGA